MKNIIIEDFQEHEKVFNKTKELDNLIEKASKICK